MLATDVDSDDASITYSVSGTDAGSISIGSSSGLLTFNTAPDYETKSIYSVVVTASDGVNTSTQAITVNVTNINEPPKISSANTFSVYENEIPIGRIIVEDDSSNIIYELSGTDASAIAINNVNGNLSFINAPDFESKQVYSAIVKVSDDEFDIRSAFQIVINNVNDNTPEFTSPGSFISKENQRTIGVIEAFDADDDAISFYLEGIDSSYLNINSESGILSFKVSPDFETKSNYMALVSASDGINSADMPLTITVEDANDNAPIFESPSVYSVAENSLLVGTIVATDVDTDAELLRFDLEGGDSSNFSIDVVTGVLSFNIAPDYEEKASYSVTVAVSDGENSTSQEVTVLITNENDTKPEFTSTDTYTVVENTIQIGVIAATDGDGDALTYSLSGTDSNDINLDATSGVLSFKVAPDYEEITSYSVTVAVSDGENSTSQEVTVLITNENDTKPEFTSTDTYTVVENTIQIGVIAATDGDGDALTYSLSGTDSNDINLDPTSGVLSFKDSPNYEVKWTYQFSVMVSDGLNTQTKSIRVDIENVNDSMPSFQNIRPDIRIEEARERYVMPIRVEDFDGDELTLTLAGDDRDQFVILDANTWYSEAERRSYLTAYIYLTEAKDYETDRRLYYFDVLVSDGLKTDSRSIVVSIVNINDNKPVVTSNLAYSVSENEQYIGKVEATDADCDDSSLHLCSRTFRIIDGADVFDIDSDTGDLSFRSSPDYEDPSDADKNNSYDLVVNVCDTFRYSQGSCNGSGTNTMLTVVVDDANDAPYFPIICCQPLGQLRAEENQLIVGATEAQDPDGDSLTYHLTGLDQQMLSIHQTTGEIKFVSPPDFEAKASYSVIVVASDGNLQSEMNVTITVVNTNDNAPVVGDLSVSKNEVPWNSACVFDSCYLIGTAPATDADNDTLNYYLSGLDASYFTIDQLSGEIRIKSHPDYETKSSYSAIINVSDGVYSSYANLEVLINNINEGPYISSPSDLSINENERVVAIIIADDYEGYSSNNPINIQVMRNGGGGYPLAECQYGLDTDDCEFFSIETLSPNTARLIMTAPDFENPADSNQDNIYDVSIGLSMGNPRCGYHYPYCGQSFTFSVVVNDVNEAPAFNSFCRDTYDPEIHDFNPARYWTCSYDEEGNVTGVTKNFRENGSVRLEPSLSFVDPDEHNFDQGQANVSYSGLDASKFIGGNLSFKYNGGREYINPRLVEIPDHEIKDTYQTKMIVSDGALSTNLDLVINIDNIKFDTQIGNNIDYDGLYDLSESSMIMSANGERIAIGVPTNDGAQYDTGYVRVLDIVNGGWKQVGADFEGQARNEKLGLDVDLSSDGRTIAIGSQEKDGSGQDRGKISVYENNDDDWNQLGSSIYGKSDGDAAGRSVSLSSDGTVLALGAVGGDGQNIGAGYVQVYQFDGDEWIQLGSTIEGVNSDDRFGQSIDLTGDGMRIIIGAPKSDHSTVDSGQVKIFDFKEGDWVQAGPDLNGVSEGGQFGFSVGITSDGLRVAIGAPYAGVIKIYDYVDTEWDGVDISFGCCAGSGRSISLSEDGSRILVDKPVRLYEYTESDWTELDNYFINLDAQNTLTRPINLSGDGSRISYGVEDNNVPMIKVYAE